MQRPVEDPGRNTLSFREHRIQWTDEIVARLWDFYARTPPFRDSYFSKVVGRQILDASRLPRHAALEILDFGCGPGFMWEHMLKAGTRWGYTGLDFSPISVADVKAKAAGHSQFRGAHHVSSLPSSLAGDSFDAALLVEVVEHLNDDHLNTTVAEVGRLLKPGGVVIVTTPNDEDMSAMTRFCPECGATFHQWQHVRSWTDTSLATAFGAHGLSLKEARQLDFGDLGWARLPIVAARNILKGPRKPPHLMAIFQKS